MRQVIIDTGPLVAFLNRRDTYHEWTVRQLADIRPPLLTCEPVITEACFLLRRHSEGSQAVLELMSREFMIPVFRLNDETVSVRNLMMKYADVPASLADACLVRMTELYPKSHVLTLDSDFQIYRKHRNQPIQTIMPDTLNTMS